MHNCNENEQEESRVLKQFLDLHVKGLIIFPVIKEQYSENILRLSFDKFPLVLIDRYFNGINAFHVASDNFRGAYDVVSRLLDRPHHKKSSIHAGCWAFSLCLTTYLTTYGNEPEFQYPVVSCHLCKILQFVYFPLSKGQTKIQAEFIEKSRHPIKKKPDFAFLFYYISQS